jgi:hypothetical protein
LQTSGLGKLIHVGLIGFLMLSGVLMAVAMIPLIALILIGMLVFNLTTARKPRDVTRRTILGASANGH